MLFPWFLLPNQQQGGSRSRDRQLFNQNVPSLSCCPDLEWDAESLIPEGMAGFFLFLQLTGLKMRSLVTLLTKWQFLLLLWSVGYLKGRNICLDSEMSHTIRAGRLRRSVRFRIQLCKSAGQQGLIRFNSVDIHPELLILQCACN